jgi:uncharacterized protein YjbI with pentapeptide repeats
MSNRSRKTRRALSISAPELPDETGAESSFVGPLTAGERYTDLVISDRNIAGQTAAHVTIQRTRLEKVEMAGSIMKFIRLTDTRFDHCDLANVDWSQSTFDRIQFVDSRMTGMKFIDSEIKNVSFENCKIDLAQFRVCGFKDCRFSNCNLREADFYQADLSGVAFTGCDLRGAQLYGARLKGADFRGSQLEGLQAGVEDLDGAIIDAVQAVELARDMARMLGLKVVEDSEPTSVH